MTDFERIEEFRQDMLQTAYEDKQLAKQYEAICEDIDNFTSYYEDTLNDFAEKWREIKDLLDQHGFKDINPEELV